MSVAPTFARACSNAAVRIVWVNSKRSTTLNRGVSAMTPAGGSTGVNPTLAATLATDPASTSPPTMRTFVSSGIFERSMPDHRDARHEQPVPELLGQRAAGGRQARHGHQRGGGRRQPIRGSATPRRGGTVERGACAHEVWLPGGGQSGQSSGDPGVLRMHVHIGPRTPS